MTPSWVCCFFFNKGKHDFYHFSLAMVGEEQKHESIKGGLRRGFEVKGGSFKSVGMATIRIYGEVED